MTMKFMKRAFCVCFFYIGCCPMSICAQDITTYFNSIPDTVLPLLTPVNRADCIDFLQNQMRAEVTNRFGTKSEMTELTADYVAIRLTSQTSWQMKLLPLSDSTAVICVVSTSCAPACDSSLSFYSTDWKSLPLADFLTLPRISDFFQMEESQMELTIRPARRKADIPLMKADFTGTDSALAFTLTTLEYMDADEAVKLKPFVYPQLLYVWKDGRFVRENVVVGE